MKGSPRSLRGAGNAGVKTMVIPIKNLQLAITDPGAAIAFVSAVIGGLPKGNVLLLGSVCNLQLFSASAGLITNYTGNFSVGTVATADATLNGAEVNVIPSTAIAAATAKLSPLTRGQSTAPAIIDNTSLTTSNIPLPLNLNVIIPDASISANSILVANGTLWIAYTVLGDY